MLLRQRKEHVVVDRHLQVVSIAGNITNDFFYMSRNSSNNSGCGCLILIAIVIAFGINKCSESSTNTSTSLTTTSHPRSSSYFNSPSRMQTIEEELSEDDKQYLNNSLTTGAMPYSAVYGKNYRCPYTQCSGIKVTAPKSRI